MNIFLGQIDLWLAVSVGEFMRELLDAWGLTVTVVSQGAAALDGSFQTDLGDSQAGRGWQRDQLSVCVPRQFERRLWLGQALRRGRTVGMPCSIHKNRSSRFHGVFP